MRQRLLPLALAALSVLTTGCGPLLSWVGKPKVRRVRARVAGIDFESVKLAFTLDVSNPYPVPLNAHIFRYGLEIEGADFVKGEQPVQLAVPARGVGTVTFPARVSYSKLWRAYRRLRHEKEVSYRLHGVLLVSALGQSRELPLSRKGTVPVMHAPKLEGLRVSYTPISWRSARVMVHVDVHNPNAFPIGLRDLRYQLALGDVDVGGLTATTGTPIGPGQKGILTLKGRLAASRTLLRIARGAKPGKPVLTLTGTVETPYGTVDLDKRPVVWKPFD